MNKMKKKKNPIFILALIVLTSITIYTFAKYVIEISDIHIQTAKQFYFNSDTLQVENPTYLLYDWNGEDIYTIEINLRNYQDSLRYTNENIEYKIEATSGNENVSITTSLTNNAGTLQGGSEAEESISIDVESIAKVNEGEFIEVFVTANATSPYEKTLKATFRIYVQKTDKYEAKLLHEDNLQYANLFIENKDEVSNITIKYDNTKVILDTNNVLLNNINISTEGTQSSINIIMERNCNYVVGFIKNTDAEIVFGTDILIE